LSSAKIEITGAASIDLTPGAVYDIPVASFKFPPATHVKLWRCKMRKIILILCSVMMMLLLAGCPHSVNSVVMTNPPDKLVYIVGQDTELDLSGGEVTVYCNGTLLYRKYTLEEEPMMNFYHHINHEIDFNTAGSYVVFFDRGGTANDGKYDTFEIQVVTQEEYDAMMGQEE
jgi:hypothetical protein